MRFSLVTFSSIWWSLLASLALSYNFTSETRWICYRCKILFAETLMNSVEKDTKSSCVVPSRLVSSRPHKRLYTYATASIIRKMYFWKIFSCLLAASCWSVEFLLEINNFLLLSFNSGRTKSHFLLFRLDPIRFGHFNSVSSSLAFGYFWVLVSLNTEYVHFLWRTINFLSCSLNFSHTLSQML